VHQLKKSKMI